MIINIIIHASRKRRRESPTEVWLSLARAPGLGPGGRRFESCHLDSILYNMQVWFNGRTSAFQAEYVGSIPITCSFIFPVKSLILRGYSLLLYSLLPDRKRVMASNSVFLHDLSSAILAGSSNPNTELTSFGSGFFGFLRS